MIQLNEDIRYFLGGHYPSFLSPTYSPRLCSFLLSRLVLFFVTESTLPSDHANLLALLTSFSILWISWVEPFFGLIAPFWAIIMDWLIRSGSFFKPEQITSYHFTVIVVLWSRESLSSWNFYLPIFLQEVSLRLGPSIVCYLLG